MRVSRRNSSAVGRHPDAGDSLRHSGSSASSGPGSITAPDSACAPTAEAFSSTQMLSIGLQLLEPDGAGEPRRAGADDDDVILHDVTLDPLGLTAALLTVGVSLGRCYFGCMRIAPSRRMVSPFSIGISKIAATSCGELFGLAEARREGHLAASECLHLRGMRIHHRRVEDAGRDRHAADAEARQLARDRQRHAGDRRLGGGVGRLADLALEGGDRGGVDQQAALAVGARRVVLHERGGGLVAQEGADQVDVHHLGEEVARHRAVLAEHAAGADDAGAIDQQVDAAHVLARALHRGVDLGFGGDVAAHERARWRRARRRPRRPGPSCTSRMTTLPPARRRGARRRCPRPEAPPVTTARAS